jgi:predicted acylesterase/phospholipase RssA
MSNAHTNPGGPVRSGIVLGGGGARGLAHVGVLAVLEREGYPIDLLTGTSMGGLIAGIYGLLGGSQAIVDLLDARPPGEATRMSRAPRPELYESRPFRRWLRDLFAGRTFADLRWPIGLTAVDLDSGAELAITRGPVAPAIWATTAIPGIYAPVEANGRRLVDGGVLNPVPVDLARRMGATIALAVDVLPEADHAVHGDTPGQDQVFGGAARGDARVGQHFLQPFPGGRRVHQPRCSRTGRGAPGRWPLGFCAWAASSRSRKRWISGSTASAAATPRAIISGPRV